MLKNESIKAYWFLPSNPSNKIPGIVTFTPKEEILLELMGTFDKENKILIEEKKSRYFPIIVGKDSEGKYISLIYCYRRNYSIHHKADFNLSSYAVRNILFYIGLDSIDSKVFTKASFSLNLLYQWIGRRILEENIFYDTNDSIDGFQFTFRKSDQNSPLKVRLSETVFIEIVPYTWFSNAQNAETKISETYKVRIESNSPLSFEEFRLMVIKFHSFIDLGFGDQVFFTYLNLEVDKSSTTFNKKHPWAKVLFSQPNVDHDLFRSMKVKFDFALIESNINEIIKNWFSYDTMIEPLISQLISINKSSTNLNVDFLTVSQSLDGFHRRFFSKRQKNYVNRLNELNDFCQNVKSLNFDLEEINRIAQNRHYYTHLHLDHDMTYLYAEEELFQKTMKLKTLFYCCIMKKMGFSDDMLSRVIDVYYYI